MTFLRRLLTILILLLISFLSYSQHLQPVVSIPSANAVALGKYGDLPVSLHRGEVDVSIPIYNLNFGQMSVPISLQYSSGGVRPDVYPGWTGTNWSLHAGGMITREVRGFPDEMQFHRSYIFSRDTNNVYVKEVKHGLMTNAVLFKNNWYDFSNVDSVARTGITNDDADIQTDGEPDIFRFNFNGYSGTFSFDHNKFFVSVGNPDLKIQFLSDSFYYKTYVADPNNGSHYTVFTRDWDRPYATNETGKQRVAELKFYGFRIITPDGNAYDFGVRNPFTESVFYESSVDFFAQLWDNEQIDTWYLQSITSPTGQKINFTYESDSPTAYFVRNISYDKSSASSSGRGIFRWLLFTNSTTIDQKNLISGKIINNVYLKSIESENEKIEFHRSASKQLFYNIDAIHDALFVYSTYYNKDIHNYISPRIRYLPGNSALSRPFAYILRNEDYIFVDKPVLEMVNYGAFNHKKLDSINVYDKRTNGRISRTHFTYSSDSTKRLTLYSVQRKSKDFRYASEDYRFEYDSTLLPDYLSMSTDHWGYSNGKNIALVNYNFTEFSTYGGLKAPDFNYAKAGSLTKVYWPTGGSTKFTYEPHSYEQLVVRSEADGAFSLQSKTGTVGGLRIKQIDDISDNGSVLTRKYEYSGGICSGLPKYFWLAYVSKLSTGTNYTSERFSSQSYIPLSTNALSSPIGYTYVTEKVENRGITKYKYTNYDILDENVILTIDPTKSIFSPFSSKHSNRGLLLEKRIFENFSEDSLQLIQHDTYEYNINDPALQGHYLRAIYSNPVNILGGVTLSAAAYKIYKYPVLKTNSTTRYYTNGDSLPAMITSIDFKYSENYAHLSPKKTIRVNSRGDTLTESFTYPYDSNSDIFRAMTDSFNIINPVIQQVDSVGNKMVKRVSNGYGRFANRIFPSFSVIENGVSFQAERYEFYNYDSYGNILSRAKLYDLKEGYVWGYNGQYPILKALNTEPFEIWFMGLDENGKVVKKDGGSNPPWSIVIDSTAPKYPYTFSSTNASMLTGMSLDTSKTYLFTYWAKGSVSLLPIYNITILDQKTQARGSWVHHELKFKSSSRSLSIVIPASTFAKEFLIIPEDAIASVYTYVPGVGMSSETDPSGKTTFYEYDNMNRLSIVRDNDRNILKQFCYNIKGEIEDCLSSIYYYNTELTKSFIRNNCISPAVPDTLNYTLPAGFIVSTNNQEDVDLRANAYIDSVGQQFVNDNGKCVYYNLEMTKLFTKQCMPGFQGTTHEYTIYAGEFSSLISFEHVTFLAQTALDSRGQSNATHVGLCTRSCDSCSGEDVKCVNNACEAGLFIVVDCVYDPGRAVYYWTYYYRFSDNSVSPTVTIEQTEPCWF
ncbi:DUF5977 domain-containing protein [Gynurincola endophyticus]|uniref:DUF5977 domain-containing protein n=1 Tax=Gynurincola endophyticus TaxID=2479004 RepID=UPI000F8F14EE|nr:DUF5977 domain-containing protein [Gynurincola endophyticus]